MLQAVPPDELQETWELILPGLKKVMKHSVSHWIPEDIYHAIKSGHSVLHLMYEEHDYAGIVICTPLQHFDGKVLHIWVVYNDSKHDIITSNLPHVESMARALGAKRLTFWSPRKWERKITKFGFVPAQTEYVKEL